MPFFVLWLILILSAAGLGVFADWIDHQNDQWGTIAWCLFLPLWILIFTVAVHYLQEWETRSRNRPKPAGYVGRFRRPDGQIVHVARLKDGTLMVASDTRPGQIPKDLGTVDGRELARWTKLGSSPDGGLVTDHGVSNPG